MPFVGNAAALRDWARRTGLPPLPEQAREVFLHGAPGRAFDGSAGGVKLVLVSSDDGLCAVVTDQVAQKPVIDALQSGLRQAGLDFRLVIERDDRRIASIHDHEYLATRNQRGWRVLAATVNGDRAGEAMLTAAPE